MERILYFHYNKERNEGFLTKENIKEQKVTGLKIIEIIPEEKL
jgi:hypothetical protein